MRTLAMRSANQADQATLLPTCNARPFFRYFLNRLPTAKGWLIGSLALAISLCSIVSARGQCANIEVLNYATPVTVALGPGGAWNVQCGNIVLGPGQEKLYSFTPAVTGQHGLQVSAPNASWPFHFYIKPASAGCSQSGWTCIGIISSEGALDMGTLTAGVEYYLLVDHTNTGGFTFTKNIEVFGPQSLPPCPTSPGPANNASFCLSNAPTALSWASAATATSYEVYFGTSATPPLATTTTATSYTVGSLAPGTYYWQIRPVNANGTAGGCTVWSFTVTSIQPPTGNTFSDPILIGSLPYSTPGNNLEANCWTSTYTGPNAQPSPDVFYRFTMTGCRRVTISTSNFNFNRDIHLLDETGNQIGIGFSSNIETELTTGTYYIVVEGQDNSTGTFVLNISNANCQCDNIIPLAIATPVTVALGPVGVWNVQCGNITLGPGEEKLYRFTPAVSGQHDLQVSAPNASWPFHFYIKPASAGCSQSGWTCIGIVSSQGVLSMGTLTAGAEYYLLVDHTNTGGFTFTKTIEVVGPPPPPACLAAPTAPANNVSICLPGPLNLSWPTATGATSYEVYFGTSATPPLVTTTVATSYAVGSLSAGTYYWQVRPLNGTGAASGCPAWSFTVQSAPTGNTFSTPIVIGSLPYTTAGANNQAANCWTDDFTGPTNQPSADVFYRFTNTACQSQILISLCGSVLDTYLHLLSETGTEFASNNDNGPLCSGTASSLQLALPPGTYYIVVEGAAAATGNFTLNVAALDINPPIITCPSNITQPNTPGLCSRTVSFAAATATDNCPGTPTITQIAGPASGASFPVGVTSVSFRANDAANNASTCTFTVTINDTQAPTITCPASQTVTPPVGQCTAVVTYSTPTAGDNCSIQSVSHVSGGLSGSTFPAGVITVIWRATDVNTNSTTCSFTVTVNGNTVPSVTCPANIVQPNTPGLCAAVVNYAQPTAPLVCGAAPTITLTSGLPSGSSFPVGTTTVAYTATAGGGATATCSFTVTINDTQPPLVTCPANTTVLNTNAGASCQITIPNYIANLTASDNCSAVTEAQSIPAGPYTSGVSEGAIITVSYTATDGATPANTTTCTVNITVHDDDAPAVVCQNATVNLNAAGTGSISTSAVFQSGTDNCGTVNQVSVVPNSFTCTNLGANTVVLTVNDGHGNNATCNATVTVVDLLPPTVVCKPFTAALNAAGQATITPANVFQSGTDNCGTVNQVSVVPNAFTCANLGANTVVLNVNDGHGNNATCNATVTVVDLLPPAVVCKSFTAALNAAGQATITPANVFQSGTDNCGTVNPASVSPNAFTCANLGANPVVLTVNDGHGNNATCTATVTVVDVTPPVILCKPSVLLNLDASGNATLTVAQVNNGSSDNCGISTLSLSKTAFSCIHIGANTVQLTGADASGNTGSCSSVVMVQDVTTPVAKCKNIIANLGVNGTVTVAPASVNNGSTDNCSFNLTLMPASFNCGNIGVNTVTLKATDAGGNSSTCTATVTVRDVTAPNASCKNPTIFLDGTGHATLTVAAMNNGSSDACGILSMSINNTAFDCSHISGINYVTLTVKDLYNNTASCIGTVTVKDNQAPTAVCEDVTVQLNGLGKAVVYGADLAPNSYDNCGVWSYTPAAKLYTTANIGVNNLSITVKDWSGNGATCVSVITVVPAGSGNFNLQQGNGESGIHGIGEFTVYPNPSSGKAMMAFRLSAEQAFSFRIFDLSGRIVYEHGDLGVEGDNFVPLNLDGLAPGVYLIDFQSNNGRIQKPLMLQR